MDTFYLILSFVLAVLAHVVIGMTWYSPIMFGNIWTDEMDMNKIEGKSKGIVLSLAVAIIQALLLNIFISTPYVTSILRALFVCILLWTGFMLTTQMLDLAWNGKKFKVFLIDASHQLISILAMGTILYYM